MEALWIIPATARSRIRIKFSLLDPFGPPSTKQQYLWYMAEPKNKSESQTHTHTHAPAPHTHKKTKKAYKLSQNSLHRTRQHYCQQ